MDTHENAPLTPNGREAMVRIVIEGGATSQILTAPRLLPFVRKDSAVP